MTKIEPLIQDFVDAFETKDAEGLVRRWSTDLNNDDEFYGMSTEYPRDIVEYLSDGSDWCAAKRGMENTDSVIDRVRDDVLGLRP